METPINPFARLIPSKDPEPVAKTPSAKEPKEPEQQALPQDRVNTAQRAGANAIQALQPDTPHPLYVDFLRKAKGTLDIAAFSEDGARQTVALGSELASASRRMIRVRVVTSSAYKEIFQRLRAAGILVRFLDPDELESSAELGVLRDERHVMAHSAMLAPVPKDLSETDAWRAFQEAFETDWARAR